MKKHTKYELEANLEKIVMEANNGGDIVIYDKGRAIAKIVAYNQKNERL